MNESLLYFRDRRKNVAFFIGKIRLRTPMKLLLEELKSTKFVTATNKTLCHPSCPTDFFPPRFWVVTWPAATRVFLPGSLGTTLATTGFFSSVPTSPSRPVFLSQGPLSCAVPLSVCHRLWFSFLPLLLQIWANNITIGADHWLALVKKMKSSQLKSRRAGSLRNALIPTWLSHEISKCGLIGLLVMSINE